MLEMLPIVIVVGVTPTSEAVLRCPPEPDPPGPLPIGQGEAGKPKDHSKRIW